MPRGVPGSGKGKKVAAVVTPIKAQRGGPKGPRRPASIRLKELREKYETYKAEASRKLGEMQQKMAVLETAAAREEDVGTIRKRYAEKSQDDIDRLFDS